MKLDDGHWMSEGYSQRMSKQDWKQILLDSRDKIIYRGNIRQLKVDKLGGFGVVEVSKEPLKTK